MGLQSSLSRTGHIEDKSLDIFAIPIRRDNTPCLQAHLAALEDPGRARIEGFKGVPERVKGSLMPR